MTAISCLPCHAQTVNLRSTSTLTLPPAAVAPQQPASAPEYTPALLCTVATCSRPGAASERASCRLVPLFPHASSWISICKSIIFSRRFFFALARAWLSHRARKYDESSLRAEKSFPHDFKTFLSLSS